LERLEAFVRANGISIDYSADIAPAKGVAEKEKITLLPKQTMAETFATLVHEQAHLCGDEIYVAKPPATRVFGAFFGFPAPHSRHPKRRVRTPWV